MLAAAVAAAIGGNASAQNTPTTGGLDEVTVTANRNIVDTCDLVRNVPDLTGNANVGVGTSSSLYIRGIGNAESIATFDVPVGTYSAGASTCASCRPTR